MYTGLVECPDFKKLKKIKRKKTHPLVSSFSLQVYNRFHKKLLVQQKGQSKRKEEKRATSKTGFDEEHLAHFCRGKSFILVLSTGRDQNSFLLALRIGMVRILTKIVPSWELSQYM